MQTPFFTDDQVHQQIERGDTALLRQAVVQVRNAARLAIHRSHDPADWIWLSALTNLESWQVSEALMLHGRIAAVCAKKLPIAVQYSLRGELPQVTTVMDALTVFLRMHGVEPLQQLCAA